MTDYKDTLNLPNTGFAMKAGLPAKEPKMIEFWEKMELTKRLPRLGKEEKSLFCTMALLMQMAKYILVMLPKKY